MKTSGKTRATLALILLFLVNISLFAQREFESHKRGYIWKHWYGKADLTINLMFSDVSTHDADPLKKITEESRFGFNISAGKWIKNWGAAEINYSRGNLYGFTNTLEVSTNFNQYTVSGLLNLTQLFYPADKQTPFFVTLKLGYGLIDFNARLTDRETGKLVHVQGTESSYKKRVTEWLIPIGLGGVINFDYNLALNLGLNYHYINTDKLDSKFISADVDFNDDKDSYVSITIGLIYTFNIKETYGYYKRPKIKKRSKLGRW